MSCTRIDGPGSVAVVVVSSCGVEWPRGFPVQHTRDDGDETNGVLYRERPAIQWECRELVTECGVAFVAQTSGAWALDDPCLDEGGAE